MLHGQGRAIVAWACGSLQAGLLVDRRVLMGHQRPTGWHGMTRAHSWIATCAYVCPAIGVCQGTNSCSHLVLVCTSAPAFRVALCVCLVACPSCRAPWWCRAAQGNRCGTYWTRAYVFESIIWRGHLRVEVYARVRGFAIRKVQCYAARGPDLGFCINLVAYRRTTSCIAGSLKRP